MHEKVQLLMTCKLRIRYVIEIQVKELSVALLLIFMAGRCVRVVI
jgi:hypothetical protein